MTVCDYRVPLSRQGSGLGNRRSGVHGSQCSHPVTPLVNTDVAGAFSSTEHAGAPRCAGPAGLPVSALWIGPADRLALRFSGL